MEDAQGIMFASRGLAEFNITLGRIDLPDRAS
jgi:hypothetical protein